MAVIHWIIDFILHADSHLTFIVSNYGGWVYGLLFIIVFCETGLVVTPFLPGDSLIFAAGALCAMNLMSMPVLFVILIAAAILGDAVNYTIGHKIGARIKNAKKFKFLKPEYFERAEIFVNKHGGKSIFLARFVPIIRTFAPFVVGMGKMDYKHFLKYNSIGAVVWVTLFLIGGRLFGTLEVVKNNISLIGVGIIIISVLPMLIGIIRSRVKKPK